MLPDWHHAEGDVLGCHIVVAADLIDLVCLRHDDGMVLDDHSVCVDAGLQRNAIIAWHPKPPLSQGSKR